MTGGLPAIPVEKLRPNPANVRGELGDLSELASSIRSKGLLQPLVVQQHAGGTWLVLDGHRRLAAAKLAGVRALPCLATRPGDVNAQRATMLAAAMHKRLESIEAARAFRALRDAGMSVPEIAGETGYAPSTVSARLRLLTLPEEAQDMVERKELTVREATELARQVQRHGTGTATLATPRTAWFGKGHALYAAVREACDHSDTRVLIAGTACGQCWEDAIRANERARGSEGAA